MLTAGQLRPFAKSIADAHVALWVLSAEGRILLASDAIAESLGCAASDLFDRPAAAANRDAADPHDRAAALLAPPAGLRELGVIVRDWPGEVPAGRRRATFVRLGTADRAMILGLLGSPADFPIRPADVASDFAESHAIEAALDDWRSRRRTKLPAITAGNSVAVRGFRRQLEIAQSLRTDVLIEAPEGYPADLIAQHLHDRGKPEDPIEFIDGSLMDVELLEAVGAPLVAQLTDRDEGRATAVIRALDETPADAQERLWQWKQVFGDRMRLIGLVGRAEANTIHAELRALLTGMIIRVPRLAHRVEDIPLVATALLESRRLTQPQAADRISRAALDALVQYPWPGDVGELDQAVRQAMTACRSGAIAAEHLPLAVRSYRGTGPIRQKTSAVDLDDVLRKVERQLIHEALEAAGGNRAEAARRLGISRARLLRRLDDG